MLHLFPFLFCLFVLFYSGSPSLFIYLFISGSPFSHASASFLLFFLLLSSPSTQAVASLPSTHVAKPICSSLLPLTEPTITNPTSSLLPLTEPTITNPSFSLPNRTHNHKPNRLSFSFNQIHSSLPDWTQKPSLETHLLISKTKIQGRGLGFHLGQTEALWV